MGIRSSGVWCDVCGNPILGIDPEEKCYPFKLSIFNNELIACKTCLAIIKGLDGAGPNAWKELPEGPLKRAFDKLSKEQEGSK